ncbi:MAG: hypothetical protein IKD06_06660 [Clostridia bacterium]|nr:hypothetical protein [Clostridia bacterium]
MKKEILTRKNIVSDLKLILIKEIIKLITLLPLLIFVYLLFLFGPHSPAKGFMLIFCMIFCVFYTLIYIYALVRTVVPLFKIKNFTISSDLVTNKLEKRRSHPRSLIIPRPYTLVFSRGGKYRIPAINNYKWSNMFEMPDKNVFHSTDLNDDFYLISVGKRRNIVAYNKKMFEMK